MGTYLMGTHLLPQAVLTAHAICAFIPEVRVAVSASLQTARDPQRSAAGNWSATAMQRWRDPVPGRFPFDRPRRESGPRIGYRRPSVCADCGSWRDEVR